MSQSDLVFSNDLCAAFLAAIVHSHNAQHAEKYLGRTAMQKLTYFSQVVGVPIPCSFDIYTYGPYSDTVTFTVESLLADEVIVDESLNPKYSNYRVGPNMDVLLSEFERDLTPHLQTIGRVVKVLGGFLPNELELVATLHFIAQRQQRVSGGKPTRESIIQEFKSVKRDKFPDHEINRWYDALVGAGLIEGFFTA